MKISRLALKIVVMARQKARVKRVWAILRFFTQFGFIVFTYLLPLIIMSKKKVFFYDIGGAEIYKKS
jgi:hypothetical protein